MSRITVVAGPADFHRVLVAVAAGDHAFVLTQLDATPSLVTAGLVSLRGVLPARAHCPGLRRRHAPACGGLLLRLDPEPGIDRPGSPRSGPEPAGSRAPCTRPSIGGPGAVSWDPPHQREVIHFLVAAGADPDAPATGGVTPLHRAVRNRCSASVEALLQEGADPGRPNDNGSTAYDLARLTTGRGGTGSVEAKAEQRIIFQLLGLDVVTALTGSRFGHGGQGHKRRDQCAEENTRRGLGARRRRTG